MSSKSGSMSWKRSCSGIGGEVLKVTSSVTASNTYSRSHGKDAVALSSEYKERLNSTCTINGKKNK